MPNSFKLRLKNLPLLKKAVLVGSFLMVISVFMPWYTDLDKFRIGETFLGISGPMYLAGFLIFVAGGASFGMLILDLLEKPMPKLPFKDVQIHVFGSILSFFMLILTASVYFHPKFGVNLTDKTMGIGMILSFIGSGVVLLSGILSLRSKEVSFDQEGHLEPLIDMDLENRPKPDQGIKKDITVGEAMEKHQQYQGQGSKSNSWGQVEESINNLERSDE